MMGLSINKISNLHIQPKLKADHYFVFCHWFDKSSLKPGDLVRVKHPVYGTLVDKVRLIDCNGLIWLSGESTKHLNSLQLGPVSKKMLTGKVIFCV